MRSSYAREIPEQWLHADRTQLTLGWMRSAGGGAGRVDGGVLAGLACGCRVRWQPAIRERLIPELHDDPDVPELQGERATRLAISVEEPRDLCVILAKLVRETSVSPASFRDQSPENRKGS